MEAIEVIEEIEDMLTEEARSRATLVVSTTFFRARSPLKNIKGQGEGGLILSLRQTQTCCLSGKNAGRKDAKRNSSVDRRKERRGTNSFLAYLKRRADKDVGSSPNSLALTLKLVTDSKLKDDGRETAVSRDENRDEVEGADDWLDSGEGDSAFPPCSVV